MTTLTKEDKENLAAVSALLLNKAQSFETAVPNRALAKRFRNLAESLRGGRRRRGNRECRERRGGWEMKEEIVVMSDSPHAAELKTVTGWVSRTGHFFGDGPEAERLARYDGCTHTKCSECGAIVRKYMGVCDACATKRRFETFKKMEKKVWDDETPVTIFDTDRYFWDTESLVEYCLDNDEDISNLPLVICEPNFATRIDSSIWEHIMPDEGDIPAQLEEALAAFNKAVESCKTPLSWTAGKFAAILPEGVIEYYKKERAAYD